MNLVIAFYILTKEIILQIRNNTLLSEIIDINSFFKIYISYQHLLAVFQNWIKRLRTLGDIHFTNKFTGKRQWVPLLKASTFFSCLAMQN
jgi:hypothetical protein